MFTGIVEELGTVNTVKKASQGAVISIKCSAILSDLKIGDSVAINGVCQTAVKIDNSSFVADVSQETLNITTLGDLSAGQKVNLERAMSANGRFSGHIVSGHIDGIGTFIKKINQGNSDIYYFSAPDDVVKYMVYKGSITVDGISLTIASLEDSTFSIAVIPHTSRITTLGLLKPGDNVNLESDILAKYIEKFLSKTDNTSGKITVNYLEEHGFI